MKILAFDTTLPTLSIAVSDGENILSSCELISRKSTSSRLFVWIDKLLNASGIFKGDLDVLAVTCGPGSFTGIRIGIAAAKGLGYSLGLRIAAFSTLEVMAYSVKIEGLLLFPVINAKRGMFYGALFRFKDGKFERLTKDAIFSPDDVIANKDKVIFIGDAVSSLGLSFVPVRSIASYMPYLVFEKMTFVDLKSLKPNYLRPSDAEEKYGIIVD